MVSGTNVAYNLTVSNSSLATYALTVMTLVAVIFAPVVLLYQGWSFHVFRARVGATQTRLDEARPGPPPAPAVAPAALER
jgi:cytochrome d ubiquinol oxidase subunit II